MGIIADIGYRLAQHEVGRLIFRESRIGRYVVRKMFSLDRFLPMATPQTVMIDPCNQCNFRCSFCPTGDKDLLLGVGRSQGMMDMALFKKIVQDLREFDQKIGVLALHKDGEPLLNKNLPAMIALAKQTDVASYVETTTNASLLDKNRANQLIEAGLDAIRISVEHVTDEGYRRLVKTFSDYRSIVRNVEQLFNEKTRRRSSLRVLVKIIDTHLSEEEKAQFRRDFSPISDTCKIDGIMGWSYSDKKDFKLGLNPERGVDGITALKKDRVVCPEPFRMMAFNSQGRVSACCVDWSHELVIGDARGQSAKEIWTGPLLSEIRRLHLQGRRQELGACASCQYMQGVTDIFDIDDKAQELMITYGFHKE